MLERNLDWHFIQRLEIALLVSNCICIPISWEDLKAPAHPETFIWSGFKMNGLGRRRVQEARVHIGTGCDGSSEELFFKFFYIFLILRIKFLILLSRLLGGSACARKKKKEKVHFHHLNLWQWERPEAILKVKIDWQDSSVFLFALETPLFPLENRLFTGPLFANSWTVTACVMWPDRRSTSGEKRPDTFLLQSPQKCKVQDPSVVHAF